MAAEAAALQQELPRAPPIDVSQVVAKAAAEEAEEEARRAVNARAAQLLGELASPPAAPAATSPPPQKGHSKNITVNLSNGNLKLSVTMPAGRLVADLKRSVCEEMAKRKSRGDYSVDSLLIMAQSDPLTPLHDDMTVTGDMQLVFRLPSPSLLSMMRARARELAAAKPAEEQDAAAEPPAKQRRGGASAAAPAAPPSPPPSSARPTATRSAS